MAETKQKTSGGRSRIAIEKDKAKGVIQKALAKAKRLQSQAARNGTTFEMPKELLNVIQEEKTSDSISQSSKKKKIFATVDCMKSLADVINCKVEKDVISKTNRMKSIESKVNEKEEKLKMKNILKNKLLLEKKRDILHKKKPASEEAVPKKSTKRVRFA